MFWPEGEKEVKITYKQFVCSCVATGCKRQWRHIVHPGDKYVTGIKEDPDTSIDNNFQSFAVTKQAQYAENSNVDFDVFTKAQIPVKRRFKLKLLHLPPDLGNRLL